jgi:beta-aspartyl-peptidase (threonine type)
MYRWTFRSLLWSVILLAASIGWCQQPGDTAPDVDATLRAILSKQAAAWNAGDIDGFMQYYWKSDDLTFSSGGQITRGWTQTRDNYRRRYPTRQQMGQVQFDQLEITPLGQTAALVLGRWRLSRDPDSLEGTFTLIFRRIDGQWVIVHDHTSKKD